MPSHPDYSLLIEYYDALKTEDANKIGHALAKLPEKKIALQDFVQLLGYTFTTFWNNPAAAHKSLAIFLQSAPPSPYYVAVLEKYFEKLPSFRESILGVECNLALRSVNQRWYPGNEIDEFFKGQKNFLGNITDPRHRVAVKYELCVSAGHRKFPALPHKQKLAESAFKDAQLVNLEECGKVLRLLSPGSLFYKETALRYISDEIEKIDDPKLLCRLVSASALPIAIGPSPNEAIDLPASQRLETLLQGKQATDTVSKALDAHDDIGFRCKTRLIAADLAFNTCAGLISKRNALTFVEEQALPRRMKNAPVI